MQTMFRKTILPLLALALCLSCTRDALDTDTGTGTVSVIAVPADAVPGHIKIKLAKPLDEAIDDGLDLSFLGEYSISRTVPDGTKFDERHKQYGLHLWYDIRFDPEQVTLTRAGSGFGSQSGIQEIDFVVPVRLAQTTTSFDDPYLSYQWHYYNDGSTDGSEAGADINVYSAWSVTTGLSDVIVAVVDSGIDYTHEDLAANMWVNEAELNGTEGVDDDGNGFVDDIYGFNFSTSDGSTVVGTLSAADHGTHVAGTIAAVNNNGIGVSGVAGGDGSSDSGVRLMSVQTSDGDYSAFVGEAIIYAADNGAVLMNCSWTLEEESSFINEAIDYFNACAGFDENGNQTGPMAGGLAIFAAGNESTTAAYPAMNDNVFSVAAIGADYSMASYSNYGSWVDICAPGGSGDFYVYSTLTSNGYGGMQGTSMACPHVTGTAALVISQFGGQGFTRQQLIDILSVTADTGVYDYNSDFQGMLGAGLVDAGAAVSATSSTPAPVTDLDGSASANRVTLTWTAPVNDEGEVPIGYTIYWSTSPLDGLDPENPGDEVQTTDYRPSNREGSQSAVVDGLEFNTLYYFSIASYNLFGVYSSAHPGISLETGDNTPPEISALDGTSLTLKSHESDSLRFSVYDADGHELSCSVSYASGEEMPGITTVISEGILTLTINALAYEDGASYAGILSVTDSYDSAEIGFSFTIEENHSPVLLSSIDDVVLNSLTDSVLISISGLFYDADGETLSYNTEISTEDELVSVSFVSDTLELRANAYGSTQMTLTASDARGESASCTFSVLVRDGSVGADLYPNPVTDILNIRTGSAQTISISIANRAGAVVYKSDGVATAPFSPAQVDMSSLAGGVYYVSIKSEELDDTYTVTKL